MYLRELHIRNSGPIESLDLPIAVDANGLPRVYAFLGPNGSGKTNLLSLVGDALFEGAASAFLDVTPSSGLSRNWFRMVGATTITHGTRGGFSILKFEHAGSSYVYKEKAGKFPASDAKAVLPAEIANFATWNEDGNFKEFNLPEDVAREAYSRGAYAYFPSSRPEYPHW